MPSCENCAICPIKTCPLKKAPVIGSGINLSSTVDLAAPKIPDAKATLLSTLRNPVVKEKPTDNVVKTAGSLDFQQPKADMPRGAYLPEQQSRCKNCSSSLVEGNCPKCSSYAQAA